MILDVNRSGGKHRLFSFFMNRGGISLFEIYRFGVKEMVFFVKYNFADEL